MSSIPGTNVPPVSFPGIASGIDYNSIIQKLTSMTLSPTIQLNQQIATINAENAELIKIGGLLASVQSALTGLSDPNLYDAVSAVSSQSSVLTALGIAGGNATPGTYTITQTTLATATQITGAANVGHTELDAAAGTTASGADVPLVDSWAAITPTNGSGAQGSVTVDGVTINYDVTTMSLNQILATINSAVHAAGDATFNIGLLAGTDQVQVTDSAHPVSLGSASDQGNLLQVLRLDQAQVSNTSTAGTVTATAGVGGINQALMFNSVSASGGTTDANYLTPVTSGYFTINGVQINVDSTTDNLHSVMQRINASSAGVVAAYNSATGQITLTSKNTGAQSIVVGSSSDTSNFLTATGLTSAAGAATTVGKQASVTLQTASGGTQTVYSNSNTVTNAISGVQLNLLSATSSPFQVTVSQDTSTLVSAINTFVSAYNSAISEINSATAAPVVPTSPVGSGVGAPPAQPVGAGILFGNADVELIKDQLVNEVSSVLPNNNGSGYTSLSQIGLNLTDSFTLLQQSTTTGSTGSQSSQVSVTSMQGTDGQLQALNASKFAAAFTANPTAVQNLLYGTQGLVQQMGSYLTGVTGLPTQTQTGLIGSVPATSLMLSFQQANDAQVSSIQEQVKQIQENANMQADQLRAEFVQTETSLAGYQALQQQLGSFFKGSGG
ncbi:MAG TPA: flagellar filament capping protein FliD [Candidatus Baltobacteraceae bacterium]|nr:flagellar filament capping protein FliD [Candidatus Baltobacteraceae bacterium]